MENTFESLPRNEVSRKFFDFYLLLALSDFVGEKSLNHYVKVQKIEDATDDAIEELYKEVLDGLKYSVTREARHCEEYSKDSKKCRLRKAEKEWFAEIEGYVAWESEDDEGCQIANYKLLDLYNKICPFRLRKLFKERKWNDRYGGKVWGEAVEQLINLPKNKKQKIIWIDHVLDMAHNSGPLLNKTRLRNLFDYKYVAYRKPQNDLDFRREATLRQLSEKASQKAKYIFNANLRQLEIINPILIK